MLHVAAALYWRIRIKKDSKGAKKAWHTIRLSNSGIRSDEAKKLLDTFSEFKASTAFDSLADCKLKEYWSDKSVQAPFIQDMTFRQIANLKVSHLLDKRSFSDQKLEGIVAAFTKALVSAVPGEKYRSAVQQDP